MEALFNVPGVTRIQDMPSELLYEIFRRVELTLESDLDSLQQVCGRWYAIIDQWMGRTVSTSGEMIVHSSNPNMSKVGLDLISEIGVNYFHVKRRDGYLLEDPPSPLPNFKLPYLLKHLRLHGTIHPDLFINLVKDAINLAILDLSLDILHHLRKSDLKQLQFPRLRKFRVTCHYSDKEAQKEAESLSLPNLHTLLEENAFPRLTRLRVDFPVSDFETIKALIGFLHQHPQMEKLGVRMEFPGNFVPSNQEEFNAIVTQVRSCDCRSLSMLQVDADSFLTDEIAGSYPCFGLWKELVMRQTTLYSLDLRMVINLNNNMLEAICTRVGSTLVRLRIEPVENHDQDQEPELDCRVFSPLKVVRHLTVYGYELNIIGSKSLPPTLQSLRLSAFLRLGDVTQILLEHSNLRFIHLYYHDSAVEENDDVKLSVELLQQVAQNRKVKELKLHSFGRNDEFSEEGIPNGDPINPQKLTAESYWWSPTTTNIHWKLNKSGYYYNAQED